VLCCYFLFATYAVKTKVDCAATPNFNFNNKL
jgi:hypothetical protein